MKKYYVLSMVVFFLFSTFSPIKSQVLDGTWKCLYATYDDETNGTGYPTIDVGVVGNNNFVALISRASKSSYYLVGYKDADSALGRMGAFPYGSAGANFQMPWVNYFDQVLLTDPNALATRGNLIYVANNDDAHNILVFQYLAETDTVDSYGARMETGSEYIWGIDVDNAGRVYVTRSGDGTTVGSILIYNGIDDEPGWAAGTTVPPIYTITMPEAGSIRGVAVDPSSQAIYATNYTTKKIYCFTGTPTDGYTLNPSFSAVIDDVHYATAGDTVIGGPWGLEFLPEKNILFVASAADFKMSSAYEYSRMYALNPNTGEKIGMIDVALWNYITCDSSYQNRAGGTSPGNASAYASTYNMHFDSDLNLYSQSYWGWTVEKWQYDGVFPIIPLTIVSVEKVENSNPTDFSLSQNYPNPFNPSTTIEFTISQKAPVTLEIYSVTGELVTSLINGTELSNGTYKYTFNASKLASGTYIYKLTNGNTTLTKKMTLLK
ncbi:MAG: T9SS type A sorting domain-containing protein [bacterium]